MESGISSVARAALGLMGAGVSSAAAMGAAMARDVPPANGAGSAAIETVVVTQRRSSLDALPEKILNTPQSINIVPAEVIREQGVANLADALKNVPGVTLNAGEGGTHGDLVNLRGFSAGDDYFLDGLARHRPVRPRRLRHGFRRGLQGTGLDAVRPRLDGRGRQPGQQGAAALSDRRRDVHGRHQRRAARHRRRELYYRRHQRTAREPDGTARQCRRASLRARPALGRRARLCVRARHRHDLHAEIPAPAGRQYSRLRHSLRLRRARAGRP